MMKGKKKRLLAGTLALLLSCSTLLNTGITALASEQSEEHAQIQEVKQEEGCFRNITGVGRGKGATNRRRTGVCRGPYHKSRRVL